MITVETMFLKRLIKSIFRHQPFNIHALNDEIKDEIYNIIYERAVEDKRYEILLPDNLVQTIKSNLEAMELIKGISKIIEAITQE